MDKCVLVYQIDCGNCTASYVGEIECKLGKRVQEHHKDSSPIGLHMAEHGHKFEEDNVTILASEDRWFQRGVAEATFIQASKPVLNRDRGRHTLPAIYHRLVASSGLGSCRGHVTSSPSAAQHNS